MILRVYRYGVRRGSVEAFEAAARDEGLPKLARARGLVFAWAGHSSAEAERGVVVTGWETFEALDATVDRQLTTATFIPTSAFALIERREISHWEALELPPVVTGSTPRVVRLLSGTLASASEEAYFGYVRNEVWPALSARPGLAGAWVGRQSNEGANDPILAVSVWRSRADIEAAGGIAVPLFHGFEGDEFVVSSVELYELFCAIPPRVAIPA